MFVLLLPPVELLTPDIIPVDVSLTLDANLYHIRSLLPVIRITNRR
jgi:hypothetical protein